MRKLFVIFLLLAACGAALCAELPGYWKDYLPGRIAAVKQDMKAAPAGDSFLFITDCHRPDNPLLSPAVAEYVMKETGIGLVVLGGDYMNANTTAKEAGETINDVISLYSFTEPAVLRGNHDTNYQGGERLPAAEFAKIVRRVSPGAYQDGDRLYYCIDRKKAR
ncbi:MAG: metallophosphoesterase, partial [Abditibacteriota bacterium]|nr:metallophosphoesterase [Abditibacteriota bacterium]